MVSETEIKESLLWMLKSHKHYVEPSGVVGLSAIRQNADLFQQFDSVCTVVTGGNMSYEKLQSILAN